MAGYEIAGTASGNTEQRANRIAEETAKFEEAKSAAEPAKASAEELEASQWAQTRDELTTTAMESAAGMNNRL